MRILYHGIPYKLLFSFQTNSPSTTTFDPVALLGGTPTPSKWKWFFGDGTFSISNAPTHTYSDSSTKTVNVYHRKPYLKTLEGLNMDDDNIVGILDLTVFENISATNTIISFINNPQLKGILFSGADSSSGGSSDSGITGVLGSLIIYACDLRGTLDLSMFENIHATNTTIAIAYNTQLEGIIFANSIIGIISLLAIGACGIQGVLDLSMFENMDDSAIAIQDNPNLEGITFANSITGSVTDIVINANNSLQGTLDLSMFESIHDAVLTIQGNPNLEGVFFSSSNGITGTLQSLDLHSNDLQGILDLTAFDNFRNIQGGSIIDLHDNPNLEEVTFADTIAGELYSLDISDCNLQGTLDLSGIQHMNTDHTGNMTVILIKSNPGLTNIIMPTADGLIGTFDVSSCDLGYIDFTGISEAIDYAININIKDNNMTTAEINHILVDIDLMVISSWNNSTLYIGGTNAAPDNGSGGYDGLVAKGSLEDKGFVFDI